jgi:cytidylate kinase
MGEAPLGPVIVAIDGAAGSGKSTLARGLARRLGVPYVNTGLMYRALALEALDRGVDPEDGPALARLFETLTFTLSAEGTPGELEIGGARPGPELRSRRVEAVVSDVARHPEVRRRMVEVQRRLGAGGGVIEGRDIGSVVFPRATAKIFLEAAPEARIARRASERGEASAAAGLGDAPPTDPLLRRDETDARTNPHVPAPGAVIIDTTDVDAAEVLRRALELVRIAARGR